MLLEGAGAVPRVERIGRRCLSRPCKSRFPTCFLTNIIRASQVHCMLAARNEDRGARISAWISADRYGPLESESNSIIRGMDMNGHTDFARRSLEFFLKNVQQGGLHHHWATRSSAPARSSGRSASTTSAPATATGCRRSPPTWFASASGSFASERRRSGSTHAVEKVPEYGLMPPGVSADWNRFAYRFFNDAQYYARLGRRPAGRWPTSAIPPRRRFWRMPSSTAKTSRGRTTGCRPERPSFRWRTAPGCRPIRRSWAASATSRTSCPART